MTFSTDIYIAGAACIAPQPGEQAAGALPRLRAEEPDYKNYIDPRLIRRMSRVVKMGTAAAVACLRDAAVDMPDAILTGTAYGCTEDTEVFLQRMVVQNEEMLTPTAFIQSTHNTIGAQIALLLQCHAYNNTYVHRALSFEHALLDALLLLREGDAARALVGGVDEMPDTTFQILDRFGLFQHGPEQPGAMAGEGAAFFLLTPEQRPGSLARLRGLGTWQQPQDMAAATSAFLSQHGLEPADVDVLLLGRNGDARLDGAYDSFTSNLFPQTPSAGFKHLCGEYPAATAYATWLAAQVLAGNDVEGFALPAGLQQPRNILIYNHFYNIHHSLILLGAC